ncbi:Methyltransferase tpcH [Hyphodiscus hymeniophilus]|uniref:Methyltransferase tpcH n=1 Tax=Hyphodiscus hymeniophilus TaxID=353542 RepID=A0A9P6VJA6_9HELO|nr:Methyltransferase tpcH [Hyphodiscus hymeniophilus]
MSTSFHSANAEKYERMASNATLNIAKTFMLDILPTITETSYILDNACGTGLLTQLIKAAHPKAHIKCADLAPGMIDIIKEKVQGLEWVNVETDVLDVRDLKTLEDNTFSHVLTNFGFSPTPDDPEGPRKAAREMWRVLREGGVTVVSTWSERSFDIALEKAALVVRPDEKPFSWGVSEDWSKGWWLMKHLEEAGFGNRVEVRSVNGRVEAKTLHELVGNMMLFKERYSEEELARLEVALKEEIRKLPQFEETEKDVGIKMVAWVGFAWK